MYLEPNLTVDPLPETHLPAHRLCCKTENMSNWEDEDWEVTATARGSKGANTRNWDDEDASSEEEVEVKKASAPMKKSKLLALTLKKKEDEELQKEIQRAEEMERKIAAMSLSERKQEEQRAIEESDFANAQDLFMVNDKGGRAPPKVDTLDSFKPVSEKDYSTFATMVGGRVCELGVDKAGKYVQFVKDLMRVIMTDVSVDDAKDLSSFMGLISNEKRDAFKKSKGYKKKNNKKASVRVERSALHDDNYDDFM